MARFLALLLLLVLCVGTGPPATALPGQLPTDTVQVSITSMTPLNPQPGKTLRLAGNVRNRSDEDVTAIQVRLLLSSGPLTTRSEIPQVTDGSSDWDGPPTLAVSEPIPFLPAHTRLGWSLELPFDSLPLSAAGVYVAGAEVIGTSPDGLTQRLGLTRTFLPWFPQGSVEPARLVWLWPVTAPPDRALAGAQLSERTAAEMAPGGRLARIIAGAGAARITWVFDPALLQTAEDMVDGYTVINSRAGSPASTGSGGAVAERWLASARQAAGNQYSMATSNALPDATALERAHMNEVVVEATERAAADVSAGIRAPVDQVLAWPTGGVASQKAVRAFRDAGATQLLLSDAALPPTPPLTYTPDGFTTWGNLPVVLTDSGLSAALAMPQGSRGEALLARQRLLSEVAMSAGELPEVPRSIVAAADPLWSPRSTFLRQTLRALGQVPYARLVSLRSARRQAVEVPRMRVPYGPDQHAAELPRDYLAAVKFQQRSARRFESILLTPAGLGYDQAVMRQTAGAWRFDLPAGEQLVRTVSAQLAQQIDQVRVATAGTFTLPGDTGRIPVTVANDLGQDVTVGIRLTSAEPARLMADDIEPFRVPAGRKISREVEAKVVGSGTLPVTMQLTTPDGHRYGEPVTVEVRTTAYSRAAAYVVTAAFVVLAYMLGMNFFRRRKARQEHE